MSTKDYDRGVNTFSPEGRLHQVEYAMKTMEKGDSAVGIAVKEGIVMAVERKGNSKLMIPKSLEKIAEIDSHLICAGSGFIPDQKTILEFARVEAQNHKFVYNEPMSTQAITTAVSDLAMNFGDGDFTSDRKSMSRPFGMGLLIGGVDFSGPTLFQTDPSGTTVQYHAKGLGAAHEGIQNILQENYKKDLNLQEALKLAVDSLKQVMEQKITQDNVEVCCISMQDKKIRQIQGEELLNIIKSIK